MSEASVDTVRRFYGYIEEGNFDGAIRMLADDFIIREPADLPYGGEYRGAEGMGELMGRIGAVVDLSSARREFLDATDPVVVHMLSRFTSRITGVVVETDVVELFYVREGRIAEIDVYCKNPSAVAALWPQQE